MPTLAPRAFLARKSALDTDLALAALESSVSAESITYAFSVHLTPDDRLAATAIGQARTALAVARGRNDDEYRRGSQDARIDTDGALAELALFAILDRSEATCAPLVSYRPEQGGDIQHAGLTFDVKSVSRGRSLVCINEKSHQRGAADVYLVAKIASDEVLDVYTVSRGAVDQWPCRQGFSPYRSASVPAVAG